MEAMRARTARFMAKDDNEFKTILIPVYVVSRVLVCLNCRFDCMVRGPREPGWSENGVSVLYVSLRDCVYLGICVSCFWM